MTYFDNFDNQYSPEKILNPPEHVEKETSIIINLLKKKNIKEVIDFGSGTGRLAIPLLKNNIKTTAVDISRKSLEKLENLSKKINKNSYLKTLIRIPDKRFFAIIGSDILHHIDLNEYLLMFINRMENRGVLIFSEPNFLNFSWLIFITLFLDWREEKRIIYCSSINLINKLKKYGFKKIKLIGLGLLPTVIFNKFPFLAKINYWLGNLPFIKLFAYRIILQAEK